MLLAARDQTRIVLRVGLDELLAIVPQGKCTHYHANEDRKTTSGLDECRAGIGDGPEIGIVSRFALLNEQARTPRDDPDERDKNDGDC